MYSSIVAFSSNELRELYIVLKILTKENMVVHVEINV